MQMRRLGRTDIDVSVVAFGCWGIVGGENWGPQDRQDSVAALRAAYDGGVTFFDTAELYGDGYSEQLLAEALSDVRDRIVIASKAASTHFAPAELREACERSLRHLRTDRIDLYQLHWPNWEIPVGEVLAVLAELKQEGKIRAYGVSNFGKQDLGECLATGHPIASNQLAYSLLFRAIEYEIRPLCEQAGVSILCYSPLMQGLLGGKYSRPEEFPVERARTRHFSCERPPARHSEPGAEAETFEVLAGLRELATEIGESMADVSLAWLLAQPAVTAVIAGARNAVQARRNLRAGSLVLPERMLQRLADLTEPLKRKLGPNADMWQTESRIR